MTVSVDETFRRAVAALQAGNVNDAERYFKEILALQPGHLATLNVLSIVLTQLGRFDEAEDYVRRAIDENATSDATFYNYGIILKSLNRPLEALQRFDQALAINPAAAETWNYRGAILNQLARYPEAIEDFDKAIAIDPKAVAAYCNKGKSLNELGAYSEALIAFNRALSLEPNLVEGWGGSANAYAGLKRFQDALAAYDKALVINPASAEAWVGRGDALIRLNSYGDAAVAYDKALSIKPDFAVAWVGKGNILTEGNKLDEAFAAFNKALALKPDLGGAWLGRGNVLYALNQHNAAADAYDKAITLKPDLAEAWLGRGNVLISRMLYSDAVSAIDEALKIKSDLPEGWYCQGTLLFKQKQYQQALAAFDKAFALRPDLKFLDGSRLYAKLQICDWTNYDADISRLSQSVKERKLTSLPFVNLSLPISAKDQYEFAKCYAANQPTFAPIYRNEHYSHDRIRIAYISSDLHDHPVGRLLAGLIEEHDRSKFETTAISTGPEQESGVRARIRNACDHFIDSQFQDDNEVAKNIRQREIDIAVDLNGFTAGGRPNIFAQRPAPLQVNYLGYAGTLGSDHYDYIIADRTAIPENLAQYYSEKPIWLPTSFMASDSRRQLSTDAPTRVECELPATGFVFCCFNNPNKLLPDIFRIWMRLLKATAGSVLWFSAETSLAMSNLRAEAERCGISPERIILASRVASLSDHLARHMHADLFLDTLPYNAHATANDALWTGLPVLTCCGSTFAGRVAASQLTAVGLPELITTSLEDYEAMALKLANNSDLLKALKAKLARQRSSHALFDMKRLARNIEAAYTAIWQRKQRGEAPAALEIS